MQGYVEFDRFTDLAASLELLQVQIHKEPMTPSSWKWGLISAHAALQGAVCMALRGGAGFDTWKPKEFQRWKAAYDIGEDFPIPKLDYFMDLVDRLFQNDSGIDRDLISWLNDTRNGLIHFNTGVYSIERATMIDAMKSAVAATVEAPRRSKGIFFYEEWQSERFGFLCGSVNDRLRHIADA